MSLSSQTHPHTLLCLCRHDTAHLVSVFPSKKCKTVQSLCAHDAAPCALAARGVAVSRWGLLRVHEKCCKYRIRIEKKS